MRSPTLTNSGTCTTAPVSSVAGFVTLETVSPRTPGSVSVTASSTEAGSWIPDGFAVHVEHLHRARREHVGELVLDLGVWQPELLEGLLVHEVGLAAVVVEELDVPHLRVDTRELLACPERLVDHGARVEALQLGAHERAALARLHVLELDDPPHRALVLDVHAVLELVRVDDVGHADPPGYLVAGKRALADARARIRSRGSFRAHPEGVRFAAAGPRVPHQASR